MSADKKRFGLPGRRNTILSPRKKDNGNTGHTDLHELPTIDQSVPQEIKSARGPNEKLVNLKALKETTFYDLLGPLSPKARDEVHETDVKEFYFYVLENVFDSMSMNNTQKALAFSHIDSILSPKQHEIIKQNKPISIKSTNTLTNVSNKINEMVLIQSKVHQVIKIQALVRCWLTRKKFKVVADFHNHQTPGRRSSLDSSADNTKQRSRMENLKIRNEIFNELLKVETTYIQRLESLVNDYLVPLRKKQFKGVDIGNIAQIFSNVEEFLEIHKAIAEELEELPGDIYNPFFRGIGDIFLKYSDEILPMYGNYVENYHVALDTLDGLFASIPKFATFLEDTRKASAASDMMSCRDRLGLPLQHLPQWGTMLSQILNHSIPSLSNFDTLANSVTILGKVSDLIQQKLDSSAANAKLLAIQRKVESEAPLNLLENPKRQVIREGAVVKANDKKSAYLFLLSDLLLITEPSHSNSLKFNTRIDIQQSTRLHDITKDKSKYAFSISTGDSKPIQIYLKTGPEKARWMADIVTLIHQEQMKRVFGVSLKSLLEMEKKEIPSVVVRCLEYIRAEGMYTEGIFRIPGDTVTISELKTAYDTERASDIHFDNYSVHDIGGLVKLFFRELPNPLFPFNFFPVLMNLFAETEPAGQEQLFFESLAKVIATLPNENRNLLHYLLTFLSDLASCSDENKMTSRNLAVVFAPNLIRPKEDTIETALLSPQISKIMQIIIEGITSGLWDVVEECVSKGAKYDVENVIDSPKITLVSKDAPEKRKKKRTDKIKIPLKLGKGHDNHKHDRKPSYDIKKISPRKGEGHSRKPSHDMKSPRKIDSPGMVISSPLECPMEERKEIPLTQLTINDLIEATQKLQHH